MVVIRIELDGDVIIEAHRLIALRLIGMDACGLRVVRGNSEVNRVLICYYPHFGALRRRLPVLRNPEIGRDSSVGPDRLKSTIDGGRGRRHSNRKLARVAERRRNGGRLREHPVVPGDDKRE